MSAHICTMKICELKRHLNKPPVTNPPNFPNGGDMSQNTDDCIQVIFGIKCLSAATSPNNC